MTPSQPTSAQKPRKLAWRPIKTAPKDGSRFMGRALIRNAWTKRVTFYGKTSHIPLYGWCHGRDVEDTNLWGPTAWLPMAEIKS